MKPRIIITIHYLELGGAETSLIGLLNSLDPEKVDVDLFIHSHQGPLMKFIPSWVNVLPEIESYAVIERPLKECLRKGHFMIAAGRLFARLKHYFYLKKVKPAGKLDASGFQYVADCVEFFLPKINKRITYDLCISFLNPHNYVLQKVHAKRKMAWIHTDYSTIHINVAQELPIWGNFDYITSISSNVTEAFLKTFPTLKSKIIEIENILSPELIHSRAHEFKGSNEISSYMGLKLLSVGRFSYAKNYDNLPFIAKEIYNQGIENFKWFIIGYGDDSEIRHAIEEAGMKEHVIILGKKENPYPYIYACDFYIQPSRYEGKSVTVREAQILHKPVIITSYPTASSQIVHCKNGYIVPMDNEGCATGIVGFIRDYDLKDKIINNLQNEDIGNKSEINKIYNLLS